MYPSAELSTRRTTDMKDTPEPLTNKEIIIITIVLLVAGWGIAMLVDTPFFQRLLQQFLSMVEEFDGETVVCDVFALAVARLRITESMPIRTATYASDSRPAQRHSCIRLLGTTAEGVLLPTGTVRESTLTTTP